MKIAPPSPLVLTINGGSSSILFAIDEATAARAKEAVALFGHQAKKGIGASAAALGGLPTLVFAGGIGGNAPLIRAHLSDGLSLLGVELNETRTAKSAAVISKRVMRVTVRIIRTNKELMILRSIVQVLRPVMSGKDQP